MHWLTKFFFVLGFLALLAVGGIFAIGWFLSPQDSLRKADAIVAISGGETNSRVDEAVRLYHKGWAPLVIFSGAAQDPTGPSNAAAMKKTALDQGVPAEDILLDEEATNTAQNATAVADISNKRQLKSIILVTSPYHQRRAELEFKYALPQTVIINHSTIDHSWRRSDWWASPYSVWLTVGELQKTLFVWVRNGAGKP